MLRKLARRYLDGEEVYKLGEDTAARLRGLRAMQRALEDAFDAGYDENDLMNEVAQTKLEEETR